MSTPNSSLPHMLFFIRYQMCHTRRSIKGNVNKLAQLREQVERKIEWDTWIDGTELGEQRHLLIINLLRPASFSSIPDRGGDRGTRELSRGNKLLNAFLERSRWLKPIHEDILQAGQHFCPNDFLQGGHDTWCEVLG